MKRRLAFWSAAPLRWLGLPVRYPSEAARRIGALDPLRRRLAETAIAVAIHAVGLWAALFLIRLASVPPRVAQLPGHPFFEEGRLTILRQAAPYAFLAYFLANLLLAAFRFVRTAALLAAEEQDED